MGVDAGQPSLLLFFTMMILAFIILSVYQSCLISATTGEDEIKTLMMEMKNLQKTNMEMKTIMARQDEKIARQDEKITMQDEKITMQDEKNAMQDEKIAEQKVAMLQEKMTSPEAIFCGYQGKVTRPSNVNYAYLAFNRTNLHTGGLDVKTGVFTSPFHGTYTITYSARSTNHNGHAVLLYIFKNEVQIDASQHYSSYKSESSDSGFVRDEGGRTLILDLEEGDTLVLRYVGANGDADGILNDILFCATLTS